MAESLLLMIALGGTGHGAISAVLKSGTGGFDCLREKNDRHVPDFDLRRCGSLRDAAEASVFAGATGSGSFFAPDLGACKGASIGVVMDRLGCRWLSDTMPGVEWLE